MPTRREILKAFAGVCAVSGIKEIEIDRIAPEDTIILSTPEMLTAENYERLKRSAEDTFGNGQRVIVLDGGMRLSVLRKQESTGAAGASAQQRGIFMPEPPAAAPTGSAPQPIGLRLRSGQAKG
jgi:hypothetical protein